MATTKPKKADPKKAQGAKAPAPAAPAPAAAKPADAPAAEEKHDHRQGKPRNPFLAANPPPKMRP